MLQITYSAMLTFARGRHHEAAVAAERALQLNQDYNMALWTLGAAQVFAGKYADGIETATRAVNVDIRDPYVHLYSRIVGYGYFAAEEYGDAADWFWKADQLAPGFAVSRHSHESRTVSEASFPPKRWDLRGRRDRPVQLPSGRGQAQRALTSGLQKLWKIAQAC